MNDYDNLENELCMLICNIADHVGLDPNDYDDDSSQIECMTVMAKAILNQLKEDENAS